MAISVLSNYNSTDVNVLKKFHNAYKKSVDEKVNISQITHSTNILTNDFTDNKIQEYLTADEKRVLREVFGDNNIDKHILSPYTGTKLAYIFKGSQIDIRL